MNFNLVFGSTGSWLAPFRPFRSLEPNKEAFDVPVVQQLCRPAVKR